MTPNIADIIRHHVSLSVRCLDRLYLQAYMPKLQTSGGLCYFLHDHRGYPIPSPALFRPMHDRFVNDVDQFVGRHDIPKVAFQSGQDKDAIVAGYRTRFKARDGIVIFRETESPAEEQAKNLRGFGVHRHRGERPQAVERQVLPRNNATSQRPHTVDHFCDRFFIVRIALPHNSANTPFENRWVSPHAVGQHRWSTTFSLHLGPLSKPR